MHDRPTLPPGPARPEPAPSTDRWAHVRRTLDLALRGVVIVPQVQWRLFDFPLQHYAFEVFHRAPANRWSHFLGIPMFMAAGYTLGVEQGIGRWLMLGVVSLHLVICGAHRLWGLVPLLLAVHVGLFQLAVGWAAFGPEFPWWADPRVHLAVWPTMQYLTHALEPEIPAPWSLRGPWTPMREFFARGSWTRRALVALAAPGHVLVEALCSPRNLLVEVYAGARRLGMPAAGYAAVDRAVTQETSRARPALDVDMVRARFRAQGVAVGGWIPKRA